MKRIAPRYHRLYFLMPVQRTLLHRGCNLAYQVRGSGPPVLMIQGVGVHGDGWLPQIEALSAEYTCLSFDNRGMGQSQPAGSRITVEQMSEDALAIMNAEGWTSAHLIGHSLGGLVAQHVALMAKSRVRSLSLLCTFADGRTATRFTPRTLWMGLRTSIGPRRLRRRAFLQIVRPPGEMSVADQDKLAQELAPLLGHDLADQPPVAMQQFHAMRAYDATPRLAELNGLPTLVVSAFHDPIAPPSSGRATAGSIRGAKYVEIPDASHGVPILNAGLVNRLLLDHLPTT